MIDATFYSFKPFIPRRIQIFLRRVVAQYKRKKYNAIWPIAPSAGRPPENWQGWPGNKHFALVLNHDVDTQKGFDSISKLLRIEKDLGFKSAFNIVPERYRISQDIIDYVKTEGFEINVHGLKHDGKLFKSREIFNKRAVKINAYLERWGATGFTAPSMICKLNWIHGLNIDHSTCTFDTDPFEPIPNPSGTIFPYVVKDSDTGHSFVELPYTLPQDHALFIILQETDISIWVQKLEWIVNCGGMALLNSHPDYMGFEVNDLDPEEYPIERYTKFLSHIRLLYKDRYWHALASEVSQFLLSGKVSDVQNNHQVK